MRLNFPYLMADTDRHGNERLFVRRFGRKIRIRALPGSAAFANSYSAALEVLESSVPPHPATARPAHRRARSGGWRQHISRLSNSQACRPHRNRPAAE